MTQQLLDILLWFCALGCALLGGLYFAFSAFIMRALDQVGPAGHDAGQRCAGSRGHLEP